MKYLSVIFSLSFFLFASQLQAQHDHGSHSHSPETEKVKKVPVNSKTDIFMVYGNCSMCESRIEKSLAKVKGVHSANWNVDNEVMTVKYDEEVTTLDEIKKKVAAVGHDTDKFKTKDEVYNSLPGCCQYERPKS